jgi:hypothetical protein
VQFSCDPERPTCTCATGAVCGFPGGLCTQPSAPCLATTTGAAYIFTRSGTTWSEQDKLGPTSSQVDDNFGGAVALSADTAIVGAFQDHDRGPGAGATYVYSHTGTTNWLYRQKLLASDGVTGDGFGVSVAAEVGSRVLVGAFTSDTGGADAGAAYVFDLDVPSGSWVATQKLTAADAAPSDLFGNAVAVSGDVAVVGAYGKSDTATVAGAAYVFEPLAMAVPAVGSRGQWTLAALLLAAAAVAGTRGRSSVRGGVRGRGLR